MSDWAVAWVPLECAGARVTSTGIIVLSTDWA